MSMLLTEADLEYTHIGACMSSLPCRLANVWAE